MKTFIETNITKSRSFILYGKLSDDIWCSDLMPRKLEYYLIKVLKECGYEHIVFYGDSGAKGAHCYDAESARFFFRDANKGIPHPKHEKIKIEKTATTEDVDLEAAFGTYAAVSQSSEYLPGDIPEEMMTAQEKTEGHEEIRPQNNQRVRYSSRGLTIHEFLQMIQGPMLNKESKMAVVFYNIASMNFNSLVLRDNILENWEKYGEGNLCLMLYPESENNADGLVRWIVQNGLESKFLQPISNSNQSMPNPTNCIRIGQPNEDEITNMLRYLAIVGTEKGNKIKFQYRKLKEIAQRIQYVSGKKAGENENVSKEYMKDMFWRLSNYIDAQAGKERVVPLAVDDMEVIWKIKSKDEDALQELNKPGWEPAYQKVTEVLTIAEKTKERMLHQESEYIHKETECVSWGVQRVAGCDDEQDEEIRSKIPNFVLLGNPGTGKSTIARLIGKILHHAGILKIGHCVEVKKQDLTSIYHSGDLQQTMSRVAEAEEGVLFIDEAHLLGKKDGGANHEGSGAQIVSTLNATMTSPNHHFSVVLAGYEEEMEEVYKLDSGFKSRFGNNFIYLKDYSPELLTSILVTELEKRGYFIDKNIISECQYADTTYIPIQSMVERIYSERDRKRFGNARVMEDLADFAEGKSQDNFISQECFYGGIDGKIDEEWFKPRDVGAGMKFILQEMEHEFVGMTEAKNALKQIGLELEELQAQGKTADDVVLRPIILVGNPGTGKSTLAELLPRLYFHYGVLGTSKSIEISASELASQYQGGSQEKILEKIKEAQDVKGFLFVDEAHELCNKHFDGVGAFKAFLKPTTDKKHPFLACFAVYPDKLEEFLSLDSGSDRRFRIIHLEDYTPNELFEIMKKMLSKTRYTTTEETDNLLMQVFERIYVTRTEKTGNAGKVERIIEEMAHKRRQRCVDTGITLGSPESMIFVPEDIPSELCEGMSLRKPMDATERLEKVLSDFEKDVVGMENVKRELRDIAYELQENDANGTTNVETYLRPIIFVGNPGTGKSTLAGILPKLYTHFGLLHNNEPIKISASQLASRYQGGSQEIIREHIERAQKTRACLFVDEAHELLNDRFDGRGAFKAFMEPTTDREHPFLACFAVYPDKLDDFIAMDSGADRRFRIIYLEDYSGEEMLDIMKLMMSKKNLQATDETFELMRQLFERIQATSTERTGNAGKVERILEDMDRLRRKRCVAENIPFGISESRVFVPEDIPEDLRRNLKTEDGLSGIEKLKKLEKQIENERVGAQELKKSLMTILKTKMYNERFSKVGRAKVVEPGHYFFLGNPGTGKTTGAEYFAKYLCELGVINDPVPRKISASDLIGEYLGQTGTKTKERLKNSVGKLLFVDEAYALTDANEHANSYKKDAINEIINFLDDEKYRKCTCVVFAGYEEDMQTLYKENKGFKSRVKEIRFADFTLEQSIEVFKSMLNSKGIGLSPEAEVACIEQVKEMKEMEEYANGRTMRKYSELLCNRLEERCINNLDIYAEDDLRAYEVQTEDIPEISIVLSELNVL